MRSRRVRAFLRNRTAVAGAVLAAAVTLGALVAPAVAPHDPLIQDVYHMLAPPGGPYPLGTDDLGRDVLSRILYGARVSITVGVFSVLIGTGIGTFVGLVAGYFGGPLELGVMRVVDILMSFPVLVMGLMFMAILGTGMDKLIVAIGLVLTPQIARLAHGAVVALREMEYITAARAAGAGPWRILRRHVLPNVAGEILVMATLWMATAIRVEANLSFIGLGVSPPTPTWGNMIREGVRWLVVTPWLSVFPGLAIVIAVLGFNMVGDGLRDAMDPKLL
ncbi:MAG: ABC transporter permease [Candidatus Acetothermia bacterium]|jgi:peptide/nickel transport system permease protein|nr:ABC transporter permease [Candidatus Acetothermia bacterium]